MKTSDSESTTAVSHEFSDAKDDSGQLSKVTDRKDVQLTDQTNLLPFRKILVVFLGLASCIVVTSLDSTIVATALPTISAAFHAGEVSSWVPSASLLTSTAFQPLYGRFSDIFGRKVTLCVAMGLFVTGSLGAGFSRSMVQLIIFRGVSGAGGGGIITLGQVVVSDVVSLRDRGKYQGIIGGVNTFGYAVGPLIGGALAQKVSWRWCFWITVPISVAATAIVIFIIPLKPVRGDIKRRLLVVDYMGAMLTLVGCSLILLPLVWGGVTLPWTSLRVYGTLLWGVFVLILFCLWEWKGAKLPIVPMYIFRYSTVTGVYIAMFIFGFVYWSSLFYIPQFFQAVLGYSPVRSGIFLLPILVSQTSTSFLAGIAVSRTGRYRTIVYCGFTVWSISLGCLSTLDRTKPTVEHVIFMLLCGIGAGQTQQTTIVAAQASVPRSDMSVVTAVRNFLRFLGGTLSLAVGSSIINNSLISAAHSTGVSPEILRQITKDPTLLSRAGSQALNISVTERDHILQGYTSGFRILFILNACLAAIAAVVAFIMIKHQELIREDDAKRKVEALREVDTEMRLAHKKGIDEERIEPAVPDSAVAPAPVNMGRKKMGLEHTKRIDGDSTATLAVDHVEGKGMRPARANWMANERFESVVPNSTATLAVDHIEGKGMRPARANWVANEMFESVVPNSTAISAVDHADGHGMRSARANWVANERFESVVPNGTATLAVDLAEENGMRSARATEEAKGEANERFEYVVPNSTATLAVGNVEGKEMGLARAKRAKERLSTIVPDGTATLAVDPVEEMYAVRAKRVAKERFSTIVADSTTTLPFDEADWEKQVIAHYGS